MRLRYFLFNILSIIFAVTMWSCKDETWDKGDDSKKDAYGTLSLEGISIEIVNSKAFDNTLIPEVNDFIVEILKDGNPYKMFSSFGTMPSEIQLPTGTYTLVARSGDVQPAAWWAPYFEGRSAITIEESSTTQAQNIKCSLANIKVTVKMADNLRDKVSEDSYVLVAYQHESNEDKKLKFTLDEIDNGDEGYFEHLSEGKTLIATFNGAVNGSIATLEYPCVDLSAGKHCEIVLSLKEVQNDNPNQGDDNPNQGDDDPNQGDDDPNNGDDNPGSEDPNEGEDPKDPEEPVITTGSFTLDNGLVIDVTVTVKEIRYIIDADDPNLNPDDPNIPNVPDDPNEGEDPEDPNNPGGDDPGIDTFKPFTSDYMDLTGENDARLFGPEEGQSPAILYINSRSGFTHIYVKIEAPALVGELGPLNEEFDLAYPTEEQYETLSAMGLSTGDDVRNQKQVIFDVTDFIPLLQALNTPSLNHFYITSWDGEGRQTIDLKFRTY